MAESISSRALDELLDREDEKAKAFREAVKDANIHRTVLWKYRKGKRKPDANTLAILDRASHGEVPANGWEDIVGAPSSESGEHPAVEAPDATGSDDK